MGCSYRNGGWQSKMERMQAKMDRMRSKMEGRDWWGGQPSSGNRAFDEYRTETLRRLYRKHELWLVRLTGLLFIGFAVNTLLHAWQCWHEARAAAR